jgi:hypothetical protein
MNLENHLYRQFVIVNLSLDVYHCNLYQISGGALDDGIYGKSLGLGALVKVLASQIRNPATAPQNGLGITGGFCLLDGLVPELLNRAVSGKVILDEPFRLGLAYTDAS